MHVASFTFNAFQENTYVLYDNTGQCVIIDPGCSNTPEQKMLTAFIEKNKLTPIMLLNTHAHIDHVWGNAFVKDTYNIPILMHKADLPILTALPVTAEAYGFKIADAPAPDQFIEAGETIRFGDTALQVFFTPGHSPGSVSFYNADSKYLIAGDVLFLGSIGRYDFPGGNYEVLMNSITQTLFALPDDTKVYSGHGPTTTIGHEKRHNPFVQEFLEAQGGM